MSEQPQEERSAATPSREALRRIRELEAINAQITRHRDKLAAALERISRQSYSDATRWGSYPAQIARRALSDAD